MLAMVGADSVRISFGIGVSIMRLNCVFDCSIGACPPLRGRNGGPCPPFLPYFTYILLYHSTNCAPAQIPLSARGKKRRGRKADRTPGAPGRKKVYNYLKGRTVVFAI